MYYLVPGAEPIDIELKNDVPLIEHVSRGWLNTYCTSKQAVYCALQKFNLVTP